MLCIIGRRIPIKILGGLILGGYIYRYTPRRSAPGYYCWQCQWGSEHRTVNSEVECLKTMTNRWCVCVGPIGLQDCSVVASARFVARRGKDGNYGHGHSRRTSGPGAAPAWWLIVLWLMQYWSKELWVVDICTSWSRRLHITQYLDSWLSDLLHSEQKLKLLEVKEGHVPQCSIANDVTAVL